MSNKIKLCSIILSTVLLAGCGSVDQTKTEEKHVIKTEKPLYNTIDNPTKIETFDNSIKINKNKQKYNKESNKENNKENTILTEDDFKSTTYWDEDFLNDIEIVYIDGYDNYNDYNDYNDYDDSDENTADIKTYSNSDINSDKDSDEPDTYNYSWKTDGEYWYFEPSGWKIDNTTWYTLCNCVANEAGSYGITNYNKALVCEVIFNRLWDWGYNSVYDVVAAYNQFEGSENYIGLTDSYYYKVNNNVIDAVAFYCSYPEVFNEGYHFFYGDGYQNHFRY